MLYRVALGSKLVQTGVNTTVYAPGRAIVLSGMAFGT